MIALLFALLGFMPQYDTAYVVGISMEPTLIAGDVVLIDRFAYGTPMVPHGGRLALLLPKYAKRQARRGEVVMVRPSHGMDAQIVKRVIGLPGERLGIKDGTVSINGLPLPQHPASLTVTGGKLRHSRHEGGGFYRIIAARRGHGANSFAETLIPEGHYMVMGDNRGHSEDSRSAELGFVAQDQLLGRVEARLFSLDLAISPFEIWRWPAAFRGSRMLQRLDAKLN